MSKKAKQYTAQEKARVAMEAIKGGLTMAQISSQYGVHCEICLAKRDFYTPSFLGFFEGK